MNETSAEDTERCPECGTEMFRQGDELWCDDCELEWWREGDGWWRCGTDGKPKRIAVTDGGQSGKETHREESA